jgi:signal peptidase I
MKFDSMEPTIPTQSNVIVDHAYYKKNQPNRWEVVVFTVESEEEESEASLRQFMKRIVGLPGETIQLTTDGLKVGGMSESAPSEISGHFSSFKNFPQYKFGVDPYRIPDDSVFVIGDNTDIYVSDSREHGAIPLRNLKGRVLASISTKRVS